MKLILLAFSIIVGSNAQLPRFNFGSNGLWFSNRFFNGSFTPPQGNIETGAPGVIPQFGNPLGTFERFVRPVAGAVSNAINNVNSNWNSNVNNAVNTARSGFGSLITGINRNLWKSFQDTVNRFAQQRIADPSAIFDRMSQFLPNIAQNLDNISKYAKTAANSDVWKNLPSDVQKRLKNRMQNVAQWISEVTSAINKFSENLPEFVFDHGLNSTLRNQPFFFPGRTGIVHLFEWKFEDIAVECEQVLGPNGYGGVQVSPVNEYLVSPNRAWWERYQPISFKINSRSGDQKQFSDMVQRCLRAGIRIYVDVVVNHMAAPGGSAPLYGTAGSTCDPLGRQYPAVPFNSSHFHADCVISNYKNATDIRDCELSSLPDLDQSSSHVREEIVNFLNHLIDLGVAGFRMDACKHMWPKDLKAIYDSLKPLNPVFFYPPTAKPFIYQEVIDLGGEAVSANEYTDLGVVTEFKWSTVIGQIFGGSFQADALNALTKNGSTNYLLNSSQALVFVDNHDNQRGHGAGGDSILTYKKKPQYIQAVAFTLATDYGIARVMSSYNFTNSDQGPPQDSLQTIKSPGFAADGSCLNGWVCEHRWPEIRRMIRFKNYVKGTTLDHIQATSEIFAFCRGEKGFIVFNNSQNTIEKTFHTCLPQGKYCDIISGDLSQGTCTGNAIEVDSNGDASITLTPNSVIALYRLSKI